MVLIPLLATVAEARVAVRERLSGADDPLEGPAEIDLDGTTTATDNERAWRMAADER